jgi:tetratricopeptide (TPR) repeat protein
MRCRTLILVLLLATGGAALAAEPRPSPAELRIAQVQQAIAADPDNAESYAELAIALARRARETADPTWYDRAQRAAEESLERAPGNLAGERARIWVLLGKHEFADARNRAEALNRRVPDDLLTYAFLVDAYAELGEYAKAEEAAQWLLDLRPGNVPGLTRAAFLRELFGDVEGSLQLLSAAYGRIAPTELEDRAWVLTQMAHLELSRGRPADAQTLLVHALELFPDYHYALANMALAHAAQGRLREAVDLMRKRYGLAPHPENLYALGVLLHRAGERSEAETAFAEFENKARAEMEKWDNANRELVFYYCDYAARPDQALQVARLELARRRDVFTLDAYAWALHANERFAEARRQLEQALAVGIRDASMLYRAGAIAAAQYDAASAEKYFRLSLETDRTSAHASAARRALNQLSADGSR